MCARAATAYGATLVGLQPGYALVDVSFMKMDFYAVILIAALAVLLSLGTKEGATFNTGELLPSFSVHGTAGHLPCLHNCDLNLNPGQRIGSCIMLCWSLAWNQALLFFWSAARPHLVHL